MADFFSPQALAGMRGLGAGLLAGSGYSPAPVSFGQALGGGLLGAEQAMQDQQRMALAEAANQRAEAEAARAAQMQPLAMQLTQAKIGEMQAPSQVQPVTQWAPEQVAQAGYPEGSVIFTDPKTGLPKVSYKPESSKSPFERASGLRDEATKALKTVEDMAGSYARMESLFQPDPNLGLVANPAATRGIDFGDAVIDPGGEAAADIALLVSFMKLIDPGSVVRESEFATASNAAGVPDRIRNVYNSIRTGERLTAKQRQGFLRQAGNLYQGQLQAAEPRMEFLRGIAEGEGLDVGQIIPPMYEPRFAATTAGGGAQPGLPPPSVPTRPRRAGTAQAGMIPQVTAPPPQPRAMVPGSGAMTVGTQANPVPVATESDAEALPAGTYYQAPDGTIYRRE